MCRRRGRTRSGAAGMARPRPGAVRAGGRRSRPRCRWERRSGWSPAALDVAQLDLPADPWDHLVEDLLEARGGLETEDPLCLRDVGDPLLHVVLEGVVAHAAEG